MIKKTTTDRSTRVSSASLRTESSSVPVGFHDVLKDVCCVEWTAELNKLIAERLTFFEKKEVHVEERVLFKNTKKPDGW